MENQKQILNVQKQLLPDLLEVLNKRYTILRWIFHAGTIGRRTLAQSVNLTERVLRSEVEFLKAQGLIEIESQGMQITHTGQTLLEDMEPMYRELFGLTDLEENLRKRFELKQVIVVPGDSDTSPVTKQELGRAGSMVLRKSIGKQDVVAVTGGSTMAEVANWLNAAAPLKGNWFVPARGGLGESVELQANTIASTMAKKTGAQYRLLHVPDHLSEDAYQSLRQDPNIDEILQVIRGAKIVVHGIGEALHMARRRKADSGTVEELIRDGAVAEAFGYYFDRGGHVVHRMSTLGLHLEDIERTELVLAVAGGRSKGLAISAVLKFGHEDILITDEAAAECILSET